MTKPPPCPFPLTLLYQDQHVVILDKPAGVPVHAGPKGGPCVEDCFPLLSRRKDGPWLAHRLDTETSGCLAIALRKQPLLAMQKAFADKTARKTYWAVVEGGPEADQGTIALPLTKTTAPSGWRIITDPKGAPARTDWQVLGRGAGLCWLELTLHTGRTHQARVHCAAMGWPIVGIRFMATRTRKGLHLLARSLTLPLTPPVSATAPPRAGMQEALRTCGWRQDR